MGRRKGEKIMKIPAEFEDIFRGVELTEREALFLGWITSWDDYTIQNMRTVLEKVRSTLSTLQAENEKLRAELKSKVDLVFQQAKELDRRHLLLQEQEAELEQVKRALAMMWFAYVNSDKETPHSYETDALEEAEHILGPWAKCMPKYLRRGPEEG